MKITFPGGVRGHPGPPALFDRIHPVGLGPGREDVVEWKGWSGGAARPSPQKVNSILFSHIVVCLLKYGLMLKKATI